MVEILALALFQSDAFRAAVNVDFSKPIGKVPAYILGQNTEAGDSFGIFGKDHNYEPSRTGSGLWDPDQAKPNERMLEASREAGMSMLRFPGGCLSHNYDWKKAVGPVRERPNFAFGVDEFIAFCRAAGAEPLITVSDYVGGPTEAAELVEYLNAPADSAHPWAMKRAQYGHPRPYRVRYFEMGNESDHGNHDVVPRKQFSAAQYVDWFNACASAMRAVDPSVQIGALTSTTFPSIDTEWNETVLRGVAKTADFIVSHTYAVQIWSVDQPVEIPSEKLMRACMASSDQFEFFLGQLRNKIDRTTGRKLPLAITEYNAMFVQEKPKPYRFSMGGALFSADWIRVLMKPELNVLMANYWQFSNGYWGMVRSEGTNLRRMPAYELFRLWAKRFGSTLVKASVTTPRLPFEGGVGAVQPAQGDSPRPARITSGNLIQASAFEEARSEGMVVRAAPDGTMVARLDGVASERHLPLVKVLGKPGARYRVSFEARTSEGLAKGTLGLSVIDIRGWEPYHSGTAVEGAETTREWKTFTAEFPSLPSAPGILLAWRVIPHGASLSGTFEVRNVKVWTVEPASFAGYSAVTATASLSSDGKKGYLVVFNKHSGRPCQLQIKIDGKSFLTARRWTTRATKLDATDAKTDPEVRLRIANKKLSIPLPPGSMTAIEFSN